MKRNSGFTLIELMIVVAIIAIIAAIAIPAILRARISGNETSATSTLRTLVTQQNLWLRQDADGNGINDFWVIDVCGMYRVLRQTTDPPSEVMMVDLAVARSDWSPDGAGDGGGGEFPIVEVDYAAGSQVPGLAAMSHGAPVAKSGYYVAAFRQDAAGTAYAIDQDGAGQAYENTSKFAFMAFPDTYDGTGMNAFITDTSGVIWRIDAALGTYNLSGGPVNASPGTPPVTRWPHANPANAGYSQID